MPPITRSVTARTHLRNFWNVLSGRELRRHIQGYLSNRLPSLRAVQAAFALPGLTNARLPNISNIMMMEANGQEAPIEVPPAAPAHPNLAQPQITSARRANPGRGKLIAAYTIAPLAAGALSLVHAATDIAMYIAPHFIMSLSNAAAIATSAAANASLALLLVGSIHLLTRGRRSKETVPAVPAAPAAPAAPAEQPAVNGQTEAPRVNGLPEKVQRSIDNIMARAYGSNLDGLSQAHIDLKTLRGHIRKGQLPADLEAAADVRVKELTDTIESISRAENLIFEGRKDLVQRKYFIRPASKQSKERAARNSERAPLIPNAYYLGRGAMGEVYRGIDAETGESVALKLLLDLNYTNRFETEFNTMAKVDSDSVVRGFAHGGYKDKTNQTSPMIAMEYVRHQDLDSAIRSQTLTLNQIIKIAHKIASAMAEVHLMGITHRDLKPSNIFVNLSNPAEPSVKISDFGLAKDIEDMNMTKTGVYAGTPPYSAPYYLSGYSAQHAGKKDPQILFHNDRYSLGVLVYKMLTSYTLVWAQPDGIPRYIGEENIKAPGSDQIVIEAMDMFPISLDYKAYQDALAKNNTTEANQIQARWNIVQDFTELKGVRVKIKIPPDIFAIINKLAAFDPNKGYQDFQLVGNEFRRLEQNLTPDAAGLAHARTQLSEVPAEATGTTRVQTPAGRESLETIGSQDVLMIESTGIEQVLDRLDLDRAGKIAALSDIVFEAMDVFSTLKPEERDQLMLRMSQIKLTARLEKDEELLVLAGDAMQHILTNG